VIVVCADRPNAVGGRFSHAATVGRKGLFVSRKLHVGNLPLGTTDEDLRELFAQYGVVTTAGIVIDKNTGRSRGFGFVEMDDGVDAAIRATHGRPFQGRTIVVNDAQPRAVRPMAPSVRA
jgi:RNA recognition motif-containing protein